MFQLGRRASRRTATSPRALAWLLLALAAGALSCRTPRTEVLVVVELDPAAPPLEPVGSLVITVRSSADAPNAPPRESRLVALSGAGAASLPVSFGVHPENGGSAHRALITVDACGVRGCAGQPGGSRPPVVTVRADVGFVADETRVLTLRLSERCAGVACGDGRTCDPDQGVCVDDRVDPSTLPAYDPDGGADAGPPHPVVVQLSAGGGTTCARSSDGTVRCWGGDSPFVDYATLGPAPRGSTPTPVPGIEGAIDVAVGYGHACAVMPDRTLRCWGRNDYGQLGDGSLEPRDAPVAVPGISDVAEVRAGYQFTCARRIDETVWCWGADEFGQLGDANAAGDQVHPTQVAGLAGVVEIAVGGFHACARLGDGTVQCWGADNAGQIGDGVQPGLANLNALPTPVMGLTDATQLALGGIHSCARRAGGTVACWGNGAAGQLGVGLGGRPLPGAVPGIVDALEVRAGVWQTCARLGDRTVRCWGRNDRGQVGDGSTEQRTTPVAVSGLADVVSLAVGAEHACAQRADLSVVCWGSDASGALGSGRAMLRASPAPVRLPADLHADAITAGALHNCALVGGSAWCWGATEATGLLPGLTVNMQDGPRASTSTPTPVPGLSPPPAQIAVGFRFTCTAMADGTARCWGRNGDGEVGNGATDDAYVPTEVSALTNVRAVTAGEYHACALRWDGSVACWGSQGDDQIGAGHFPSAALLPLEVPELTDAVQIAARDNHTCVRRAGGGVRCWGSNGAGELGGGNNMFSQGPTDVVGVSDATAIGVTFHGSWSRGAGGALTVWGYNGNAFLQADSTANNVLDPTATTLPETTRLLAGSSDHACGLDDDGSVSCWGVNDAGQLGDGTSMAHAAPTRVRGLSGSVNGLGVGDGFSCALATDGAVSCWGANDVGSVGDGSGLNRGSPTLVSGVSGATQVSVQNATACALTREARAFCWGENINGELGDESGGNPREPVAVLGVGDNGGPGATEVATGINFSCARLSDGTVRCWGSNNAGQLGDGTLEPRAAAVTVTGLTDAVHLALGANHACALRATGDVVCWGSNGAGQVGDGALLHPVQLTPVAVTLGGPATSIGTCDAATCAVMADKTVRCWGYNASGQLGDGTTTTRSDARPVSNLSGVTQVVGGRFFFCALRDDGSIACWGANGMHQLGDPARTTAASSVPVDVQLLGGAARAVYAGTFHACARFDGGVVRCWGGNGANQIASEDTLPVTSPLEVPNAADAVDVSGGQMIACAARADGTVVCWGLGNAEGELGDGSLRGRATAALVHGLSGVEQISTRYAHTCALLRDGTVRCWGIDWAGQLGSGHRASALAPVSVRAFDREAYGVHGLSAGAGFTCANMGNQTARCWGANFYGQVGQGGGNDSPRPTSDSVANGFLNVQDVAAGSDHVCVLLTDGSVQCWGHNDRGQLGNSTMRDVTSPVRIAVAGVRALAAGGAHTCALLADGTVRCWGANDRGQVGNGATSPVQAAPVAPAGLPSGVVGITAGGAHTCAWTADALYCWGANDRGQVGDGSTVDRAAPVVIVGVSAVTDASAGRDQRCAMSFHVDNFMRCAPTDADHTCAVRRDDGAVYCWGANDRGQVGDGSTVDRASPVAVAGLPPAASVRAGGTHSCARTRDGASIQCWGDDTYGQLGDGAPTWTALPVPVPALAP